MNKKFRVTCQNNKKQKKGKDKSTPFSDSGNCDDEITLVFGDHKKLFASKNFLRYASPVFEVMFNHDFKEKRQNSVELTGKTYDEFLEFLLCIHPRILKSITEENVLRIVAIAEEYQVTPIISKCKDFMEYWLLKSVEHAQSTSHYLYHAEHLRHCIHILAKAAELNYDDVVSSGVKTIAKFGHILYNHKQETCSSPYLGVPSVDEKVQNETLGKIKNDCMKLFNALQAEIKYQILSERLLFWDDIYLKGAGVFNPSLCNSFYQIPSR